MLKIKPPDYKFCPFCGKILTTVTFEGKRFKHCKKDNWTYYPTTFLASAAVTINKDKVLLVKRNREPYKGTWMLPAGFVDYGEHPEETLIRELREETRLIAKNPKLMGVYQGDDDPRAPGVLLFVYRVEVEGKLSNQDKDENTDIGWFDIKAPPEIGWKVHQQVISKLQEERI